MTDEFLQITVAKPMKNGVAQFGCTSNHLIRTPGGWVEAGKLKVGDRVLEALPHYLSEFQMTALRGTLMGDGAISPTRSGHGARFRYTHCGDQTEYADWKASLFCNVGSSRFVRKDEVVTYDFQPMPELAELREDGLRRRKEGVRRRLLEDVSLRCRSPFGTWTTRISIFGPRAPEEDRRSHWSRDNLCRGDGGGDARAARGVFG